MNNQHQHQLHAEEQQEQSQAHLILCGSLDYYCSNKSRKYRGYKFRQPANIKTKAEE